MSLMNRFRVFTKRFAEHPVYFQLSMFGNWRSSHVNFVEKSAVAFEHLYLLNWSPAFETLPYPPASGPYAVYTIPDFYNMVNFLQTRVSYFYVLLHVFSVNILC